MKILFVTANRVGDAVLSTGLLAELVRRHPGARITLACGPAAANLFEAAPNVERIIVLTKGPYARHWLGLWRATVGQVWDLVVDLRASALAWTLMARSRRVMRTSNAPEHRLVQLARVLALAAPAAPEIWITEAHRAEAARLVPDAAPVLAIGPTANWGGKRWRPERFAETANRLTAPGAPLAGASVAVLGGLGEEADARPVIAAIPAPCRIDLVGRVDLLTAYACLQRCALFIGNDSGLMHLAAASATPTLGLFGPSREVHYAPWGPRTAVVRTAADYEELVGGPGYDHRRHDTLMDTLAVEAVEAAAKKLLGRQGEDGAA